MIIPWLRTFCETYPHIELQLLATSDLVDLAARQADIALRMTAKPPEYLVGREVMPLQHGIYGTTRTLRRRAGPTDVILFRGEGDQPQWVVDNFADTRVALRVDDVSSMVAATRNHLGLSRLPCYVGDSDRGLRRLAANLEPSDWGVWILSHVDLRATARVRVCREFLLDIIERQRPLIQGTESKFAV